MSTSMSMSISSRCCHRASYYSRLGKGVYLFLLLLQNAVFCSTLALATDGHRSAQQQDQHQHHQQQQQQQQDDQRGTGKNFRHMVVLVHGYLGSYREQEYLGEALMNESRKALSGDESCRNSKNNSNSNNNNNNKHEFVVLNSRVNSGAIELTTDGIAAGGKRLASEVTDWVEQQIAEVQKQSKSSSSSSSPTPTTQTVMTLSFVGNSLGGLYSRYALAELETVFGDKHDNSNSNSNDNSNHDNKTPSVLPMIFCTTSSPHLGVSQETFIELPKWTEPYVSSVFRQKTMDDLFGVHESTVVADLCHANNANTNANANNNNNNNNNCDDDDDDNNTNFLRPLGRFRKRIAMANAYNTDFLVSVASGAFLSAKSNSVHHHQDSDVVAKSSIRLMRDLDHVALQVATLPPENDRDRDDGDERASRTKTKTKTKTRPSSSSSSDNGGDGDGGDGDGGDGDEQHDTSDCVDALDELGWLKIFVDTRGILPKVLNFDVENLTAKHSYTSRELHEHFRQYGTMLPVAHPLNMANSKTDWYRLLTKSGRPVVDALAELLVRDTIELSEEEATTTTTTTKTTTATKTMTKTTTKSGSCEGGNANGNDENDGNVGNEL